MQRAVYQHDQGSPASVEVVAAGREVRVYTFTIAKLGGTTLFIGELHSGGAGSPGEAEWMQGGSLGSATINFDPPLVLDGLTIDQSGGDAGDKIFVHYDI